MLKIPFVTSIANAAAGLTGSSGEVTRQAERADCRRQTVDDPAQKVQAAGADAHDGGPTRAQLIERDRYLCPENAPLWDWLDRTIDFPPEKQREFTVTATARRLSPNQVLVLLDLLLGQHAAPARATRHRWTRHAAVAATRVLKALAARCRALILVGGLDEIFFRGRPVLVGIEPARLVWFLGPKARDRSGATWAEALRPWPALAFVAADAGTGLQAGIAAVQRERREAGQPALETGRDVFHTTDEAPRALRRGWDRGERLWEEAEIARRRRVERSRRPGEDARGAAVAARNAWTRAAAACAHHERSEAGGEIAHEALSVFRRAGQLNDRAWAERPIALALPLLSGHAGSKVRNFLQANETLTFLDRLHRQLREAVPEDQLRGELVRLWWRRRPRPRAKDTGAVVGAGHGAPLVQQVVGQERDAHWRESSAGVARVRRQTVRGRSVVECRNGVLRMHQSRHQTVTQGLLDLKRLYWNCRAFREGKRRRRSPYQVLGLKLPSDQFWDLLWMPTPAAGTT